MQICYSTIIDVGFSLSVKVVCGSAHTLALTTNGMIYSWGKNNAEQLGHDSKTEKEVIPTMVTLFI